MPRVPIWLLPPFLVLFKEGLSGAQKVIVEELKDVLEHYDIDWYLGTSGGKGRLDNLIIAPNTGHSIGNLTKVRDVVMEVHHDLGSRSKIQQALRIAGENFRDQFKR